MFNKPLPSPLTPTPPFYLPVKFLYLNFYFKNEIEQIRYFVWLWNFRSTEQSARRWKAFNVASNWFHADWIIDKTARWVGWKWMNYGEIVIVLLLLSNRFHDLMSLKLFLSVPSHRLRLWYVILLGKFITVNSILMLRFINYFNDFGRIEVFFLLK